MLLRSRSPQEWTCFNRGMESSAVLYTQLRSDTRRSRKLIAIRCSRGRSRPLQYGVPIAIEPPRQLRPLRPRPAASSARGWLRPSLVAFPVVAVASRQTGLSVIELDEALVLPSSTVMAPPHETPDQLAGDRSARDANSPEVPKLRTSWPGATLIVDTSSSRHLQISGAWSGPSPSDGAPTPGRTTGAILRIVARLLPA